jgi:hypothetical protein
MIEQMRCIISYDFQNYFLMEESDVTWGYVECLHVKKLMILSGL